MKSLIQNTLKPFGFQIVRRDKQVERVHKPFYLLGFLIGELMKQAKGEVTFVQAGAADGVLGDPLRPAILRYNLRGLLIEPVPASFERLRKNYSDQPQVRFANCGVASTSGTRRMFGFDPEADAGVHRLSSFVDASTDYGVKRHEFDVQLRTIPDLLAEHDLPNPTILVVDVEGLDAEIVCAALDAGIRPELIMYESAHIPSVQNSECLRKLRDSGYSFVEADVDTYAVSDALCNAAGAIYT